MARQMLASMRGYVHPSRGAGHLRPTIFEGFDGTAISAVLLCERLQIASSPGPTLA
jgi:hypothetical protein